MSEARLGVFLCDCGDKIASILDVEALEREVRHLPGVAVARRLRYGCSPDGLAAIRSAIAGEALDRVLVAGCTPRTLEPRFRAACQEAGLSGDLFELVDIREGCAWVHLSDPEAATAKAMDLIRMGVARCALRQTHPPVEVEIVPAALVIGGGLAGLTAALTLANAGLPVKLVEREAVLGGMLRDAHTLYPDRRDAAQFLADKIDAVTRHSCIEVMLEHRVVGVSGRVGRYTVSIDRADGSSGPSAFEVGAVVIATGACNLQPWGLFRYDGKRVVTQLEFERELRDVEIGAPSTGFPSDVVMILCAGQRDDAVPYCSGVCCMGALKQALEVKAAKPQTHVTLVFRDLYLLGEEMHETQVLKARQSGVAFVRYTPSSPPVVSGETVEVHDLLTGTERCLPYDRVVLATPLIPQPDAGVIAHAFNIVQDHHGFLLEERYRLRPQNCAERGIYVCGTAHGPASWTEVEFQAASAAFRAARHLLAGRVAHQASVVSVDETLCTGCGGCVESCSFGAISMRRRDGVLDVAQIDSLLCKGCGNCVVTCPVKAIRLPVNSDAQLLAQIEAALASLRDGEPRILVFGCEWSGCAAAELAGARKLSCPVETRLIRVGCSARLDPLHVLWAFISGADGVFLGACPPGDCHYVDGNRYASQRIDTLGSLLAESGFDPRRLRLEWITPDDAQDFVDKIADFTSLIRALGPSLARPRQVA